MKFACQVQQKSDADLFEHRWAQICEGPGFRVQATTADPCQDFRKGLKFLDLRAEWWFCWFLALQSAFLVDVKKTFPRQLQSDLMLSPWGLDDKETLGARSQAFLRGFGSPCWAIILPPWCYGIGLYSLGVPEFLLEASSLCLRNFKVDCWYI